jgi:hypothetical protein
MPQREQLEMPIPPGVAHLPAIRVIGIVGGAVVRRRAGLVGEMI